MDQTANLNRMTDAVAGFLPEKLGFLAGPLIALLVIVVGYFISKIIAGLVSAAINRTGIGKRAKTTGGNIGKSLSKAVFWVLWLVFILLGLGQFPMVADQLTPVKGMLNSIFEYVPNIIGAGIVLAVGTLLAKVVKEALSSTLEAAQVDRIAGKYNFAGAADDEVVASGNTIARSMGGLASAVVILFAAIAAINTLKIPGISEPISEMLSLIVTYIPNILGASLILAAAVFIGRFVSRLARNTLPALGVDNSLQAIGNLDGSGSTVVPSRIIGTVGFVGIVLMGLTAAMRVLGIEELTAVFNSLLEVGGRVVLGAVIIGAGLFIANFISRIVTETSGELAGRIIKYATIIIVTFMGLSQMNLGEEIVDAAFRYTVMAAAVAAGVGGAIAFGLGGREWAAKKLVQWFPTKK